MTLLTGAYSPGSASSTSSLLSHASRSSSIVRLPMTPPSQTRAYSRSGIGGCGNYHKKMPPGSPSASPITTESLPPPPPSRGVPYTRSGIGGAGNIHVHQSRPEDGGPMPYISKAEQMERERIVLEKGGDPVFKGIGGKGNRIGDSKKAKSSVYTTDSDSDTLYRPTMEDPLYSSEPLPYTAVDKLSRAIREMSSRQNLSSASRAPKSTVDSPDVDGEEKKAGRSRKFFRQK